MIDVISAKLKKPVKEILKICHPKLMSILLPNISEKIQSKTHKAAQRLKLLIDNTLTSKASLQYFTESLDEVIIEIFRNMHDPNYLSKLCYFDGNVKDDKNPFCYDGARVVETLRALSINENNSLLGKLALEFPRAIIIITLYLQADIEKVLFYDEKVFCFYKYIFFVEKICQATGQERIYKCINTFILRDVVYTLIAVIQKDEEQILTIMACQCIKKIFEFYLENFSEILGKYLPAITSILIPLVNSSNEKSIEVLHYLIYQNYSIFEKDIAYLDPFPATKAFCEINELINKKQEHSKSLYSIIDNFIKAGNSKNSGCRIEGLKYLCKSLSEQKDELKRLYENLANLRGFSEDCEKSLLHQLTCMLVELTFDKDMTVIVNFKFCHLLFYEKLKIMFPLFIGKNRSCKVLK